MRVAFALSCLVAAASLASCSRGPSRVTPPKIDPSAAAQAAIDQYDKNGDGALSAAEVENSALSVETWDADKNGSISRDDLERRLRKYVEHGTGMIGLYCYVRINNQPLPDAQVTFTPEEFLGGAVHPASGTTGRDGMAILSVAEELRPRPELEVVQIGLYKVQITHPQVAIKQINPSTYELAPGEDVIQPTFRVRQ